MGKRVKEVALNTRTARMKLAPRHKPYFRLIVEGLHLGYRRSAVANRAGAWLARRYVAGEGYETHHLGAADDLPEADMPADGVRVLTFLQADAAARAWAREKSGAARAAAEAAKVVLVRDAVESYLAEREARDPRTGKDARLRLTHHVLGAPIAEKPLCELGKDDLEGWRKGLRQGGRAGKAKDAPLAPATVARLLNDLRAALTERAREAKAPADALAGIRKGLEAPKNFNRVREAQTLSDADVRRLIAACEDQDGDFGAMVLLLASTGARFDQLARVTVADFQPGGRRIMVPVSNKGNGDKQKTHTPVPLTDDVVARISPLTAGRRGHERLLVRWHHRQVAGDKKTGTLPAWERVERRPWEHAGEMARMWRAALNAVDLPKTYVPYALRHSSIVRMLKAGLAIKLVAEVHDTSAAMIDRHYGKWIVNSSEELLRNAAVSLASAAVIPMRSVAAA